MNRTDAQGFAEAARKQLRPAIFQADFSSTRSLLRARCNAEYVMAEGNYQIVTSHLIPNANGAATAVT
jgi:hypothetical protein